MADFVEPTIANNAAALEDLLGLPVVQNISPEEESRIKQIKIDEYYVNQFYNENKAQNFAVLKLSVNANETELIELYTAHIAKHNAGIDLSIFTNSGFDLFVPDDAVFDIDFATNFVDLKIKGEMIYCDKGLPISVENAEGESETVSGAAYSCGYYVYPRSSISKTPLVLANHVGIIDSGYRGNLIAALRKLPLPSGGKYTVEKHTRLFQVCHPSLCPVFVVLVPESELNSSERGNGGFGSTGAVGVAK